MLNALCIGVGTQGCTKRNPSFNVGNRIEGLQPLTWPGEGGWWFFSLAKYYAIIMKNFSGVRGWGWLLLVIFAVVKYYSVTINIRRIRLMC